MSPELTRRRMALFVFFFIPGISMASWVTRTPAIRDHIHASLAEMGMVLLGLSFGSMLGVLLSGLLVSLMGTKPIALLGTCLVPTGQIVMALGAMAGLAPLVGLGLALFGFGMGLGEIAINIEGAAVEQITGKPLMHTLHGCFSLGTVCGAALGFSFTAIALPVEWHLTIVAALIVPVIVWFGRFIPSGTARTTSRTSSTTAGLDVRDPYWCDVRLYLIGLIVLGMALAEGAANDWLPILMVDEHGYSQTVGSLVFVMFAAAMTLGRFCGSYFLTCFGRANVIRGSALLAALGLACVIFTHEPLLAILAVLPWGLGASLGFPIAISAAGSSGRNAIARVRTVTISGYVAFLIGPPLLGLIGETAGLRQAMMVVMCLLFLAACVAQAVHPRPQT